MYGAEGGRTFGVKREIGPSERYIKKELSTSMREVIGDVLL